MRYLSRKSQSLVEYSVLFAVILSALLIMQFYIKRRYQGRIKEEMDQVGGQQYAPGHTTSIITTTMSSDTTSYTGGGHPSISLSPGVTLSVTTSNSTMDKKEKVDSFAAED